MNFDSNFLPSLIQNTVNDILVLKVRFFPKKKYSNKIYVTSIYIQNNIHIFLFLYLYRQKLWPREWNNNKPKKISKKFVPKSKRTKYNVLNKNLKHKFTNLLYSILVEIFFCVNFLIDFSNSNRVYLTIIVNKIFGYIKKYM